MDESRFDAITRAAAVSRRCALKLALAGAMSGLTALAGDPGDSRAARRGFSGFNPFSPDPTCSIEGAIIPANSPNPANSCQFCDPGLDSSGWSPVFGAFCGDGSQVCCAGECCPATHCCSLNETCTPCRCEIEGALVAAGIPNPAHDCQICDPAQSTSSWSPVLDQSTCGGVPGRVCCNGECCSPTECCTGISCEECGPHCHIGGQDIDAGVANAGKDCEVCNPELAFDNWSPADDGASCNQGDGCCTQGACGSCSCTIDGKPVADQTNNPRNDCQECNYARNPNDWSNRDNFSSCENNTLRDCCDGECCAENECCTVDGCELCCLVPLVSDPIADGVVNPRNTCQLCDANRDSRAWTTLDDGEACGATGNSECCNGECCPSGQCCRNGECGLCDCQIGPDSFPPDTINQSNPCEICKPALNRFGWSAVASGTSCGSNGETCCGGDCCTADLCCLLEACGECLCSIENEIIAPGKSNPEVDCQVCDPHANPFDWSPAQNGAACGPAGDQQCCNGLCCPEGQCCLGGACHACGCLIEEQEIASLAENPENGCQYCDPARDPLGWSPRDDGTTCGETGVQCCSVGECTLCGCLIGGVAFTGGASNPDNACQQCDAALDPSGWSPRNETFSCGPAGDRICCNGVCCESGEHCNLDDACESNGCTIEQVVFQNGDRNPANECQLCNPDENETGWTAAPDGDICGPNLDQTCCAGECGPCEPGCLIDGVHYGEFDRKPGEFCEICDPRFPNQWSPRQNGDCPPACLIGGELIRYGTLNPENLCQICRGGDDWSPSTELFCGPNLDQVCCAGVCCDAGACCSAEGSCGVDNCQQQGCVIDGAQYEDGTENPANACQVCQLATSATSWTARFGSCGENFDRFCCDGVCCELGACCTPDSVCAFDACETCAIGGVLYFPEDRNPANGCEICHANSNKFGWTPLPDFSWCDEMQLTTCCRGICCDPGEACQQGSCQPV